MGNSTGNEGQLEGFLSIEPVKGLNIEDCELCKIDFTPIKTDPSLETTENLVKAFILSGFSPSEINAICQDVRIPKALLNLHDILPVLNGENVELALRRAFTAEGCSTSLRSELFAAMVCSGMKPDLDLEFEDDDGYMNI